MTPLAGEAPPEASSTISPEQAIQDFLTRLPASCRLLVAFSGGGDSTGLLAALSRASKARPGLMLHAATVDHRLRAGSAEEAASAAAASAALGVPHATLEWTGDKPATGIQAAARQARYRLLVAEARRIDADFIVTGHTRDDQEETIAMRRLRNPARSEGMDAAVLVERSIWVLRPFLDVGREAIRAYLRASGQTWSEDPSNDNPAFERVRIRQSGAARPEAANPQPDTNGAAAAFIRQAVRVHAGLAAVVDVGRFDIEDPAHWMAIAMLAAILGGREFGPDSDVAAEIISKIAGAADFRISAHRVLFYRKRQVLYIHREARGLAEISVAPGTTACWDGRYEIVNAGSSPVLLGAGRALTAQPLLLPQPLQEALPRDVVQRLDASSPRIIAGDAGALAVRRMLAPFEKFLPARRLNLANSLADAFGLEPFPSPSLV